MVMSQPLSVNKMLSLLKGLTKSSRLVLLLPFKIPRFCNAKTGPSYQSLVKSVSRWDVLELLGFLSLSRPQRATGERDLDGLEIFEYPLRLRPRRERRLWRGAVSSEYESDNTDLSRLFRPLAQCDEWWSVLRWYSFLRLPGADHGRLALGSAVCFHLNEDRKLFYSSERFFAGTRDASYQPLNCL